MQRKTLQKGQNNRRRKEKGGPDLADASQAHEKKKGVGKERRKQGEYRRVPGWEINP